MTKYMHSYQLCLIRRAEKYPGDRISYNPLTGGVLLDAEREPVVVDNGLPREGIFDELPPELAERRRQQGARRASYDRAVAEGRRVNAFRGDDAVWIDEHEL